MSRKQTEELLVAFRGLVAALVSYSAGEGRRLGLSLVEIAVVEQLQNAGELTPTQIGQRLAMTSGTVTGVLDRLERAGYIERVRNSHDRRSVVIRATGPVTERVRQERALLAHELEALAANLNEDEQQVVARYLASVAATITRYQGDIGP